MKATETIIVDGQTYYPGQEIPDFGSLVCTEVEGNRRKYEGKYKHRNLLPKYDNLGTGSSAFLSDSGNFVLLKYYADTKTWEGNGEVI